MADYDFQALSPPDFEALAHDLMKRHLCLPLQAFTSGRDKGIDIRFCNDTENSVVIQCKHYARSGFSKLKSHLKSVELAKIQSLQPKRYVLVTSVGLTPDNVDELYSLLSPYCTSKQDIIGCTDINAILRNNGDIETAHFKLWISSQPVLSKILNNDVFVRSCISEAEIRRRVALYVPTNALESARKQLSEDRVVVIAGVPGVGKTTLAEMLLAEYIDRDWEVIKIEQNISEGLRVFKTDAAMKQLLYYDDFLGQISVGEKLAKNEDRSLVELIKTISASTNKRLILTTREYILEQAKTVHEHLSRSQLDLLKFVVKCEDYSDLEKAKILANHLYFYDVPQEYIAALIDDKCYRQIIRHRNYNPRIVEWMTNEKEIRGCTPLDYRKSFIDNLNNPSELWSHAFDRQLSEAARHVLLVLVSCGPQIYLADLRKAFESFFGYRAHKFNVTRRTYELESALNELEGNFIVIRNSRDDRVISLHNPSISDFLVRRLSGDASTVTDLLKTATFFEQVERLLNVFDVSGKAVSDLSEAEVESILDNAYTAESIHIISNEEKTHWFKVPRNDWQRLKTLCSINQQVAKPGLKMPMENKILVQLEKYRRNELGISGGFYNVARLFGDLEKITWSKSTFVDDCRQIVNETVAACDTFETESIESLEAIAEWLTENRASLGEKQSTVADKIVSAVETAVQDLLENDTSSGTFEEASHSCTHLEELLSVDLSRHIGTLDDALDQAQKSEYEVDEDAIREWRQPSNDDEESVDSIIESLLD
jgi:hypothetical protein